MISDVASAMNAYQQALGRISGMGPVQPQKPVEEPSKSSGFSDVLSSVMNEAVDVANHAEKISMQGIAGKADVQDVVLAIANAEQTLDTVVALRDSAVKAYKELMQLTI